MAMLNNQRVIGWVRRSWMYNIGMTLELAQKMNIPWTWKNGGKHHRTTTIDTSRAIPNHQYIYI